MKLHTVCLFLLISLFFAPVGGWTETSLSGMDLGLHLQPGDQITACAISDDNTLFSVGLFNPDNVEQNVGTLLFDLQQKKELIRTYESNRYCPILIIAFSGDNQYFFAGDDCGYGTVRKCSTGEIVHRVSSPREVTPGSSVFPMIVGGDFSTDSTRLVTADHRGYVQLWNVETGEEIKQMKKREWGMLKGVEVFDDGSTFLLTLFSTGAYIASFEHDSKNVLIPTWPKARIHKNGQWVIAVDEGTDFDHIKLTYYDKEGKKLQSFGNIPRTHEQFVVHPEGLYVAELDKEKEVVRVFDPKEQNRSGKLENTVKALPNGTRFFGEGQIMVTTLENKVKFFDLQQLVTGIKQTDLYEN